MRYRLAIFDLDGTILDTIEDLADSVNYALAEFGYPVHSVEEVQRMVGNGLANLVKKALLPLEDEAVATEVLACQKAYYGVHCADKTRPYDGIIELLLSLKEAGYQLAVVSNKADFAVQLLCEKYFPGIFDAVVGERETVRRKPAPDSVEAVLRGLAITKEQAVYIGDSEVDIQTAENAGMDSILVSWGFRGEEALREAGAKCIVSAMIELKRCLFEENLL